MDLDRPHRTTSSSSTTTTQTTTSELFICFTSRLSHSSSMRLTSKSTLSPAHSTEKSSLTTSLSRRLRHNGSLRGGQSPAMFSSKKNRGGPGFDNPEPSSPKVTCIGQVRVKTKKQGQKMKMRACRSKSKRLSGGEASFRRIEHGGLTPQNSLGIHSQAQDRKWVHLPLTICEALRAFGSEFSCLLPCKSSCFSSCNNNNERDDKGNNKSSSCGAVCRWLVALQEGEEKGRDIELVVGEEERESRERMVMERECSRRRSIFDDMEFKDEIFDVKNGVEEAAEEESGRVSICIPPKNALLLMRCRSDPMKMSALSQKIWEAPVNDFSDDDDDDEKEEDEKDEEKKEEEDVNVKKEEFCGNEFGEKTEVVEIEKVEDGCDEMDGKEEEETGIIEEYSEVYEMGYGDLAFFNEEDDETDEVGIIENRGSIEHEEETHFMEEENQGIEDSTESPISEEEKIENNEKEETLVKNEVEEKQDNEESSQLSCPSSEESTPENEQENDLQNDQDQEKIKSMLKEEENQPSLEDVQEVTHQKTEKWENQEKEKEMKEKVLPDCLLLMMCEPKLSMEVSKETWVCSTDFIRWLPDSQPQKKPTKPDGSAERKKKKIGPPVHPGPVQPGRSSISFPTGVGPVEQKLAKSGGGGKLEPLVLTRCKSAPMRSTVKIAGAELPCSLWRRENSRKIEPHRPSFGAAGVGF